MTLEHIDWQDKGYHLLLVQSDHVSEYVTVFPLQHYFHLFVSADGEKYGIYDRLYGSSLEAARESIRFDPAPYEAVPPPFPIVKERALSGETGIPTSLEPMVQIIESQLEGQFCGFCGKVGDDERPLKVWVSTYNDTSWFYHGSCLWDEMDRDDITSLAG